MEEGDGRETSVKEQSTLSLEPTKSSNNTTNQIGKMVPQGKFKGKELLYKKQVEEQQERDQEQEEKQEQRRNQKRLLPTAKNKGANLHPESMPNISTMLFFTMIPCHHIPEDFHLLMAIVNPILTSLSNKRMPILTSTDKLNLEVASWITPSCNLITSVSSLLLEDNLAWSLLSVHLQRQNRQF